MYKFDCYDSKFYGHGFSLTCDYYFENKDKFELHTYIINRVYTKEVIVLINKDDVLKISKLEKGVNINE